MLPSNPVQNTGDCVFGNHKPSGKLSLRNVIQFISNQKDIFFSKFCVAGGRSFGLILASFFNHISHIGFISSKKKMFGVYTPSVVARVTNKKARWYFPIDQNPRIAMCQIRFFVGYPELSISAPQNCTGPSPTSLCFYDLIPKSFHVAYLAGGVWCG